MVMNKEACVTHTAVSQTDFKVGMSIKFSFQS